jgi:ABC-type sugar transport system permease subunit
MSSSVAVEVSQASPSARLQNWFERKGMLRWALVLPSVIILLAVALGPVLYVLVLSFSKYTLGQPLQFVGLSNFIRAFQTSRFWHGLYVTALIRHCLVRFL